MIKNIIRLIVVCLASYSLSCSAQFTSAEQPLFVLNLNNQSASHVFARVAQILKMPIHYFGQVDAVISASCRTHSPQIFLQCVLKPGANLVLRYSVQGQLLEAWVYALGHGRGAVLQEDIVNVDDASEQLLNDVISAQNPSFRLSAIQNLTRTDAVDEQRKIQALTAGLVDKDGSVRAQALDGLAKQKNYDAVAELNTALTDEDVSVRLMAIDNAGEHREILQKALNDSDATVRQYAAHKLQQVD